LTNFDILFSDHPSWRWLLNSVIVSALGTGAVVTVSGLAGYVFAKKRFPGRTLLFWTIIATMTVPAAVTLIPLYLTVHELGWLNSYQGLMAPYVASAFGVFLIRQFMHTIPDELIDAARIDGAGEIRVFGQVIVPLSTPAFGSLAVFTFITLWNDYVWPLVTVRQSSMATFNLGIAKVAAGVEATNFGTLFAGAFVSFLPMLVVFVLFQRFFVRGITVGSVKG
jgi:multiple sugar transport system permease protein